MEFSSDALRTLDPRYLIFGTLCTISNQLETISGKMLGQLTVKQWMILAALSTFPGQCATISELSKIHGTSHQNVKQLVLKLEEKGFVTLQRDSADRRSIHVSPKPAAFFYAEEHGKIHAGFIDGLFLGMDESAIQTLWNAINALQDNLTKIQEEQA